MKTNKFDATLNFATTTLLLVLALSGAVWSQEISVAKLEPVELPPAPFVRALPLKPIQAPVREHKFLDSQNRFLFGAVAGMSAADFAVTHANLQNGGRELNPVTRIFSGSTTGLAVNFAGETAGVIGLSYFFHKTGHHKLERLTSLANIGASAVAVSYGLAHR